MEIRRETLASLGFREVRKNYFALHREELLYDVGLRRTVKKKLYVGAVHLNKRGVVLRVEGNLQFKNGRLTAWKRIDVKRRV